LSYSKIGTLTAYVGPMFAGKTTTLLKNVVWARFAGKTVHVYKPSTDVRYAVEEIVSHDGLSVVAHNILNGSEFPDVKHDNSLIVFDEVQFFGLDLVIYIVTLLSTGNDVIVVGLDMDSNGIPFETTTELLALADEVHKLKATCSVCGSPASKTFKKENTGNRIELGSSDLYEPRCNSHWLLTNDDK